MPKTKKITIEISARHVHLAQKEIDKLFGKGYELHKMKQLSQTHEFAAEEMVVIKTKQGELRARVLGPVRPETQVELSETEAKKMGLELPVRMSADLEGTPGVTLVGPKGSVRLKRGVIRAWRHIHMSTKQAAKLGLEHCQFVSVRVGGVRGLVFNEVRIKVHPHFDWHMHVDTDEANAAGLNMDNCIGEVIIP